MKAADQTQIPTDHPPELASCGRTRWLAWTIGLAAIVVVAIAIGLLKPDRSKPKLLIEQAESQYDLVPIPLEEALDLARRVADNLKDNVRDYTATVLKQERLGSQLGPLEVCSVKIREKPFSAYMYFTAPEDLKGQEALYVQGANDGKMFGHAGSGIRALAGTVQIPPNGPIAMLGQRYPITELGVANLTRRLIEVGEHDLKYGERYVWLDKNAKVGDRSCTSITVMHPVRRKAFIFHVARIFVDNELMVPVHYEAYDWPDKPSDPPILLERYTYTNLKLNPGLTDADFDPKNPQYNFGLK